MDIKVDNTSFNQDYYKGKTEKEFIAAEINGVPDSIGNEEKKIAWLKEAYAIVVPTKPQDSKVADVESSVSKKGAE